MDSEFGLEEMEDSGGGWWWPLCLSEDILSTTEPNTLKIIKLVTVIVDI